MSGKSHRREFLLGKSAVRALGDLLLSVVPGGGKPSSSARPKSAAAAEREDYFLHVGRAAMAARFELFFNVGQYPQATEVALAALDLVDALEQQLSFFRASSELSFINAMAADGPVPVEAGLFELLATVQQLSAETDGALDLTATPLWEAWGFSRREGRVPGDEEIARARETVGRQLVELDSQRRTVRFLKPGVRLNLGSVGKGYALDRCREFLLGRGIGDFLIHGGLSSVVTQGTQLSCVVPDQPDSGAWIVGVRHPLRPQQRLGEIRLRGQGLGTSGSQMQSFWHQGKRYGHIIDPRTGRPANNAFSTTVVAPSALLADALSTAFYVMEPDAVEQYCVQHPGVGAILLRPARRRGGFEVRTYGLTPDDVAWGAAAEEG